MCDRSVKRPPRRLPTLIGAAFVLGVLAACAAADTQTELLAASFVADVDGEVFVGVMVAAHPPDGGTKDVVVYLCDSVNVSTWLFGQTDGDTVVLETDGARVDLLLGADAVSGQVELAGGDAQPFTAVAAEGDAGLFRAEEETVEGLHVGGWIILNDLEQRGALTLGGAIVESPTLDPAAGEADSSIGTLTTERCFRNPWTGERICRALE
jgi:hypothetical protein